MLVNSDDVTVLGNLTVQGTQTQQPSTLNIEDKNLLIKVEWSSVKWVEYYNWWVIKH